MGVNLKLCQADKPRKGKSDVKPRDLCALFLEPCPYPGCCLLPRVLPRLFVRNSLVRHYKTVHQEKFPEKEEHKLSATHNAARQPRHPAAAATEAPGPMPPPPKRARDGDCSKQSERRPK